MDQEFGWTIKVAAVVDLHAQLVGGAARLPTGADQKALIQMEPQGGDLFW